MSAFMAPELAARMSTHFGQGRFLHTRRYAVGERFFGSSACEPRYKDVDTYEWTFRSDGTSDLGTSMLARFGPPNMSKAPQDQMDRDYLLIKEAIRYGQFADDMMQRYPMLPTVRAALFRLFGEA